MTVTTRQVRKDLHLAAKGVPPTAGPVKKFMYRLLGLSTGPAQKDEAQLPGFQQKPMGIKLPSKKHPFGLTQAELQEIGNRAAKRGGL